MRFVIGDVHGEITKLRLLMEAILKLDKNPILIFIGDYVDKGENPAKALSYLVELSEKYECIFLRGNHEYYWEQLKEEEDEFSVYLKKYGGGNTRLSFERDTMVAAKEVMMDRFGRFFDSLKNYYQTERFVMTHSGIPSEQYGKELSSLSPRAFLFNRYDFIKHKHLYQEKQVVFGHTGFYTPYCDGFKIGIDTAACYMEEQPLTAFCIDDEFFINSANNLSRLSAFDANVCPTIPRVKAWRQI